MKKFNKLNLNKETISQLDNDQLRSLKGGDDMIDQPVDGELDRKTTRLFCGSSDGPSISCLCPATQGTPGTNTCY